MTSQDRDPGKIAKAFPSRAQGLMQNLRDFHLSVMQESSYDPAHDPTFVANNPESEAAMRAEANRGKTSGRSPGRPSAATRQSLTGVIEHVATQGWTSAEAMPHLCFPPDQYPQGSGPGSQWTCRCDAVWVADGIAWDDYPVTPKRLELLKPERWHYVGGGQLVAEDYRAQEGLYDWRPLGPYYAKLYRAMIDNQHAYGGRPEFVRLQNPVDWRDLG